MHKLLVALLMSGLAAPLWGQATTVSFGLPTPPLSLFGFMFTADHIGPPMGTITAARANLTFTTETLDAADIVVAMQAPSAGLPFWTLRGADLGWRGTGTFTAQPTTTSLNGPIDLGYPVPFASLFLITIATEPAQPLGGRFIDSSFEVDIEPWTALGGGGPGTGKVTPVLTGHGALVGGGPVTFTLAGARAGAPAALVLGVARVDVPLFGATLVPSPDLVVPVAVSAGGTHTVVLRWPPGAPPGATLFVQHWIADPAAPSGLAASNGLGAAAP